MYLNEDKDEENIVKACENIFFDNLSLRPIVRTSWKEIRSFYYDNAVILPETGTIRNQINIMDTNLKLTYTTNQAAGFYSTIYILMTSNYVPENLQQVHLKIEIEGVMNRQVFDAYPNLRYEYSWDRRNAYEQRVFGITFAKGLISMIFCEKINKISFIISFDWISIYRLCIYILGRKCSENKCP
jgi:hypothetical protein